MLENRKTTGVKHAKILRSKKLLKAMESYWKLWKAMKELWKAMKSYEKRWMRNFAPRSFGEKHPMWKNYENRWKMTRNHETYENHKHLQNPPTCRENITDPSRGSPRDHCTLKIDGARLLALASRHAYCGAMGHVPEVDCHEKPELLVRNTW